MIIVIDGLSGSGKSSTAKAVAEKLDIQYLDSGALYRAVTWIWLEEDKPEESFPEILSSKEIRFEYKDNRFSVYLDGTDISREIRRQRVSDQVSRVAADPSVRNFVNDFMRKVVSNGRFIADGRDLGSAVFPDADLKFYMQASLDTRAKRRYREMVEAGEPVSLEEVKENIDRRDAADRSREMNPLVKPDDAYVMDTSCKTFDEQVTGIVSVIRKKLFINNP